jgi:CheY-like chemotaxis protein
MPGSAPAKPVAQWGRIGRVELFGFAWCAHEADSQMKILLIEDSRFLRMAIEKSLVTAGHEVTGVADGRVGLLVARGSRPALILLDMMLPGLDGTCVLKELKQDAATSQIPVIVLTGLSQKNETKMRKSGAAGYIEKSSLDLGKNANALVQAIASVLDTGEALAAAGEQSPSTEDVEAFGTEAHVGAVEGAS